MVLRPEAAIAPVISVIIPTYRDLARVAEGLPRVLASEGVTVEVVIVNNDPAQGVDGYVGALGDRRVRVIEMGHNAGFMGAVNAGIAATAGEYVMLHNADLQIDPGYLHETVRLLAANPPAACVAGKLLRLGPDGTPDGFIDSAGSAVHRNRHSFDRGEGQRDSGQFDLAEEVFGVSGAAMVARRAALEDVSEHGQYLDESFFMYRDDFDLCWRLRRRGWQCWFVPTAIGYHTRTGRGLGGGGYLRNFRRYRENERRKRANVRLHSMKNQWLVLLKNDAASTIARDLPLIAARELLVLGANLVTSPTLALRSIVGFARALPAALRARRHAARRATVSSAEIRSRWFL